MNRQILLASTIAASSLLWTTTGAAQTAEGKPTAEASTVEEVVVTGVFNATSIENAPISVAAVTADQIAQQAPVSTADALKTVPGVFVNSALGEIRNIVFSRGVSARSLEAAGGYFYVSLQEDGLPVEPQTATNFGPDYFSRLDIMTARIEALRGGTAVVTGANAPGGIFNYISKTGKSDAGSQVEFKYGLEGDGRFPLYRADAYTGGLIGDTGLYYAVGGFYRESEGAHYPGYKLNKGGQIRGNLRWDYADGSLMVTAKYLNDHNGFSEFLPARDYSNPKILGPFSSRSSVLPPASPHPYVRLDSGRTDTWDGSDLVHAKSKAFGLDWKHNLSSTVRIENKARYSDNDARWNTVALDFLSTLTDADNGIRTITGIAGIDGVYTYRRMDGSVAAVVNQSGATRTLTVNNLPNQHILTGGVLTGIAYQPDMLSQNFQDQFTLNADLGRHNVSIGAYYSKSKLGTVFSGAGGAVMTAEPTPELLSTALTRPDGTVYRVTDPAGWAGIGNGVAIRANGTRMTDIAVFAGDTWEVTDRLTADLGVRYEKLKYDAYAYVNVPATGDKLTTGGRDGNPLTLYDAATITLGQRLQFQRQYDYFAYSGSLAYRFAEGLQAYVRYTRGKKAPDFGIISTITTPQAAANVFPVAESVQQVELGVKYRKGGLFLQAFPFWSKNSNVGDSQLFVYKSGPNVGQYYSPPPVFGTVETYGIELSGTYDVSEKLNLNGNLTLQNPKARNFGTYTQGPLGNGSDDVATTVPAGEADNNPKIIARTTATYRPIETVSLFATYSYLGKRAANRRNAFYLPGFSTVDVGASWEVTQKVRLQANVTNVFNKVGIMSWGKSGSLLSALDRQALTPEQVAANPNQVFSVLPNPPRAFYVTATVSF